MKDDFVEMINKKVAGSSTFLSVTPALSNHGTYLRWLYSGIGAHLTLVLMEGGVIFIHIF